MQRIFGILALALPLSTLAADPVAVPVKIVVVDEGGAPIPTAVVRHPEEAERHPVNVATGAWEDDRLYLLDGTERQFIKGMLLSLEISAPGYEAKAIQYEIRPRKNIVTVPLIKLSIEPAEGEDEDPVIGFGRDKPIDGAE